MSGKRVHITKDDQGWKGKAEGAKRASVRGSTQREVEQAVKAQLRRTPGGGEAIRRRLGHDHAQFQFVISRNRSGVGPESSTTSPCRRQPVT